MSDKENETEKPKLKGLEEFKPEESDGKIFDFKKAKDQRDEDDEEALWPPKLRTKFCFKHDEEIFNFEVGDCKNGCHIGFLCVKEAETPFGKMLVHQPIMERHVELNKLERFLNFCGFNVTLESKVEKSALKLRTKIVKFLDSRKQAKEIKSKFKL